MRELERRLRELEAQTMRAGAGQVFLVELDVEPPRYCIDGQAVDSYEWRERSWRASACAYCIVVTHAGADELPPLVPLKTYVGLSPEDWA